jgi:hypothetical protein
MFLGAFLSFLFFYAWMMMNMEPRAKGQYTDRVIFGVCEIC